jgi:protocatechuate 4,5-dioxygenase beta chain
MLVDHAFTVPMSLLWPGKDRRPVRTVPVAINTVHIPLPTPTRCFKLGQAIGRAVGSFDKDLKVVIVGTGGLSHQLDGARAGFINKRFDRMCLEKIVKEPEFITRYSIADLIRESGAQGVELIMWLVMRGALTGDVSEIHSSYHVPISNTASAVMLLENRTRELAETI